MTKHTHPAPFWQCRTRPVAGCPRCSELVAGAAPRDGYGDHARRLDAQRTQWIKEHNCERSGCGPVCVAFDW